ncbi:hypothetical protein [Effusibacillus lacus]|uniref:Copper amine oxidase-like N-terminal domain-containing protein n=1 Tax=Effusibacillus lacus TaxID=1348429 RepID=A0A292YRR6_9BACL|nr:hypothetical protein [Effusibacillus lacus]TCS76819.1 hypothetical protein EDD64_10139 [Effusibacillus lacus]GAX91150.1 hypothetical protein EFBL_2816 [Effusibacillus lacus]
MRKMILSFTFAGLLLGSISNLGAAHEGQIHLNLNGTNVDDASVHMMPNNRIYGSVEAFARHYNASFEWKEATKTLTLNGKTVTDKYGAAHVVKGVVTAPIRALAETLGEDHFAIGWDEAKTTVNVSILPAGVKPLDGGYVVPQMGEHWADPKNLPLGPIFGIHNGKLVFLEYMPDKELNKTVKDIPGTGGVPIPSSVDHADIDWNPNGHPGFLVPHYDIHLYFIPRSEQDLIGK